MKKILFIAFFIVAIFSLSFAFADDDPKKAKKHECTEVSAQSTSATTGATCTKHQSDSASACCKTSGKACAKTCQKGNETASDSCVHNKAIAEKTCKEHQQMTADANGKASCCAKEQACKQQGKKSE